MHKSLDVVPLLIFAEVTSTYPIWAAQSFEQLIQLKIADSEGTFWLHTSFEQSLSNLGSQSPPLLTFLIMIKMSPESTGNITQ